MIAFNWWSQNILNYLNYIARNRTKADCSCLRLNNQLRLQIFIKRPTAFEFISSLLNRQLEQSNLWSIPKIDFRSSTNVKLDHVCSESFEQFDARLERIIFCTGLKFKVTGAASVFLEVQIQEDKKRQRKEKNNQQSRFSISLLACATIRNEDRPPLIKFTPNNIEHWYRLTSR